MNTPITSQAMLMKTLLALIAGVLISVLVSMWQPWLMGIGGFFIGFFAWGLVVQLSGTTVTWRSDILMLVTYLLISIFTYFALELACRFLPETAGCTPTWIGRRMILYVGLSITMIVIFWISYRINHR
jgi:hypothetical protein